MSDSMEAMIKDLANVAKSLDAVLAERDHLRAENERLTRLCDEMLKCLKEFRAALEQS
jgi:regulator of replication initiation timing